MVDLLRNGWTIYAGTTGRNPPERVDDLARNRWSESPEYPTPLIWRFKGPSGGKFNARLGLDAQWKVVLEGAENGPLGSEET